jgi:hypothetical protein
MRSVSPLATVLSVTIRNRGVPVGGFGAGEFGDGEVPPSALQAAASTAAASGSAVRNRWIVLSQCSSRIA